MQINNTTVTTRQAHPGVLEKVALEVFFIQNGTLTDPYSISGVGIYALSATGSPSSVLGDDGLLIASNLPLMWFTNSSLVTTDASFSTSNYTPGTTASGIVRLSTGRYAVVLDGTNALSSVFSGSVIANRANAVGDYTDIWQVKFISAGGWSVVCNNFHLYNDNFYAITQPLLLTVRNSLNPKQFRLGSKINLKVMSDITVGNRDIDSAVKNLFRDAVILDPQFKILKINDGNAQLPAHVTVSGYSNTSGLVDITSDNTMFFNFDTNTLATHAETLAGNLGSLTGMYALQAKYTILDQTFVSDLMHFQIL
jgi:hypothetical protein